jgi:hypothetical protein
MAPVSGKFSSFYESARLSSSPQVASTKVSPRILPIPNAMVSSYKSMPNLLIHFAGHPLDCWKFLIQLPRGRRVPQMFSKRQNFVSHLLYQPLNAHDSRSILEH